MQEFGISAAQIVGLWMETLFMGFYLVSCGFALRAFLWHTDGRLKRRFEINWILFITAIALCVVAVFDVALGLLHNIQAFIFYTGPGGSDAEFTNISDWVNVMKSVTVLIQTILGDGMLIYRCWIVYSRSWRILVAPTIFFLGDIGCAMVVIYRESTLRAKVLVNSSYIKPIFTGFYAASISLNILTTTLIVIRIWRVEREKSHYVYQTNSTRRSPRCERTRLGQFMRVVIESGLIITLSSLISVITYVTGSNSVYATSDVLVQNIGIAFNLIIIRARSQPTDEYTLYTDNVLSVPQFPAKKNGTEDLPQGMSLDDLSSNGGGGGPNRHIAIKVDHDIHDDHIRTFDSIHHLGDNKLGVRTV
ncbi:hypothetical protein BDZ94DRAFT_1299406 [Collybia nuda]|uniref:Uncharacterized protein n=1 Tax=Collybia nuda TaxID=64659 RepID=A0A9P5Y4G4_9AGAR|nr:hypothetical protein BDZ94DRAFT_1299406 [Collybia nuda]